MKKILLLIAFLITVAGVSAQETKRSDPKSKDYVIMKDGKMMVVRDGKTTVMDKEMTLGDGTRVMSDGKVMMTDGSTKILKEGESLPIDGRSGKGRKKEDPK